MRRKRVPASRCLRNDASEQNTDREQYWIVTIDRRSRRSRLFEPENSLTSAPSVGRCALVRREPDEERTKRDGGENGENRLAIANKPYNEKRIYSIHCPVYLLLIDRGLHSAARTRTRVRPFLIANGSLQLGGQRACIVDK